MDGKCGLQRLMLLVKMSQEPQKIFRISTIERAVFKPLHRLPIACTVVNEERVWGIVHAGEQICALVNYRYPLAPRQQSSQQTGNLDILLFTKPMRDGNGIVLDKCRPVVAIGPVV